jgi:diaminopimelate epimerase
MGDEADDSRLKLNGLSLALAMLLEFTKMNGAGNDFVLFDNRQGSVELTTEIVTRLCDRHAGIGADGVIGLVPCRSGRADWAWEFFNSDGSAAEMCGNGARCFARYVQRVAGAPDRFSFETTAGVVVAELEGDQVTIGLTPPRDLRLNEIVPLNSGPQVLHSLNTGVPHAVLFAH